MPDTIYISASLLRDYLECPRKVYYRLNHPELSVESANMVVGNIVHSVLERYWKTYSQANLYAIGLSSKFGLASKYEKKVRLCIDNFFESFTNLIGEKDLIEYRFKIPMGSSFIVGKMDRITSTGCIIDWKTSSMPSRNIDRDPQFILYQYVYEQIFKKRPTSVMMVNLVDNSVITYSRDKVLEFNLMNTLIPVVIDDLLGNTLSPTGLFLGKCFKCPFRETCLNKLGYYEERNELDSSTFINGNS